MYEGDAVAASTDQAPAAAVALAFRPAEVPPLPDVGGPPRVVTVATFRAPAIDRATWIASFGPDVDVFEVGEMTYVARRALAGAPVTVIGLGGGAIVTAISLGMTGEETRRIAESLHPLDGTARATYLASARTPSQP